MAYDRYDTRDERWRGSDDRFSARDRDRDWRGQDRDERGFFERAGDEVASWFGDEEAERRRREDRTRDERGEWGARPRDYNRGRDEDRSWSQEGERGWSSGRSRDWNDNHGTFARGGSGEPDGNRGWRGELWGGGGGDRSRFDDQGRDYRPMAGDYGRSQPQRFASRGESRDLGHSRHEDPHYRSWRDRHMSELDRDYDEYSRENQARFEREFGTWRERRQQKRGLLGQIREHMEVVGSDDEHVGTIDRVAGDRIILAKSDPDSGGAHHSLSCADIDRVEGDRVILDCASNEARNRWRDESRGRALFEREEQGEMGPRMLDRSFEGTYR